ncbi:hypothetical protein EYC84_011565 [Monilinia fructicola]|uniref:Uncharacterized protein n=1 Tax=Monilinia fructicola TaxID=38448 RepID=A0A5M9J5G4_MONFR|nr:hypothetical protein EYC84_011565 [Monilinia fructicola]
MEDWVDPIHCPEIYDGLRGKQDRAKGEKHKLRYHRISFWPLLNPMHTHSLHTSHRTFILEHLYTKSHHTRYTTPPPFQAPSLQHHSN